MHHPWRPISKRESRSLLEEAEPLAGPGPSPLQMSFALRQRGLVAPCRQAWGGIFMISLAIGRAPPCKRWGFSSHCASRRRPSLQVGLGSRPSALGLPASRSRARPALGVEVGSAPPLAEPRSSRGERGRERLRSRAARTTRGLKPRPKPFKSCCLPGFLWLRSRPVPRKVLRAPMMLS